MKEVFYALRLSSPARAKQLRAQLKRDYGPVFQQREWLFLGPVPQQPMDWKVVDVVKNGVEQAFESDDLESLFYRVGVTKKWHDVGI